MEEQGFDSQQEQEIPFFSTAFRLSLEPTQHPIQWVQGAFSLWVKLLRRKAGCSFRCHLNASPVKFVSSVSQNLKQYSFTLSNIFCFLSAPPILPHKHDSLTSLALPLLFYKINHALSLLPFIHPPAPKIATLT
jgi:hypothetical protein